MAGASRLPRRLDRRLHRGGGVGDEGGFDERALADSATECHDSEPELIAGETTNERSGSGDLCGEKVVSRFSRTGIGRESKFSKARNSNDAVGVHVGARWVDRRTGCIDGDDYVSLAR
jgi:hypothetical protein